MHVQPYKMDESQTKTNNVDMELTLGDALPDASSIFPWIVKVGS